ncbi:alpha-1,2-mannosyltransferase ALG9-like [Paramacrobiotus metropolitanus]|uniref:alpha-1,2-mannosyltransferase ALG9-like n=1 Tax=Paramacrobiotus metropolitanus TaxID=2943436 RepID=UPI0024458FE6|nr:alpha-1,2-mannosyltransferase ALG9-like [Paramacrobiotus metropolitanus]
MSARRFKKERHPFRPPRAAVDTHADHALSPESLEKRNEPNKPKSHTQLDKADDHINPEWSETWTPELRTAVKLLLSAKLCSMVWSYITDCDETYNYWEPLHYVLNHRGFQTWEYSPVYAIRSYAYILLHAFPLKIFQTILQPNRFTMFYFLRFVLAIAAVAVEGAFYAQICKRFGPSVGRMVLVFLLFAPGMFISSTAFLPSSFAMLMTTAAYTAWFAGRNVLAVIAVACSGILGWPFAGLLGAPIAVDIIRRNGLFFFVGVCIMLGAVIAGATVAIDSYFYGKLVFPTLNIVLYNIISGHGPELYGVEPWYFYLLNGFLNFNVAFFLGLMCPVFIGVAYALRKRRRNYLWNQRTWEFSFGVCAAVFLWLAIFFRTPHKEERFLFPVYTLLSLLAAIAVEIITKIPLAVLSSTFPVRIVSRIATNFMTTILAVFVVLSLSRSFALAKFYTAPMDVYMRLQAEAMNHSGKANLCVGKEWHRFPSSFFLPDKWNLQFIQSEFKGLLPKPYSPYPHGFAAIPTEMNDENKEEPSRYIDPCQCDYLVDLDNPGRETALEPSYVSKSNEWNIVYREKFLDASNSHRIYRAFYVPFLSERMCSFGDYVLLNRKRPCAVNPAK